MVPADSRRIPRAPRYSGYCYGWYGFAYGPVTFSGGCFHSLPLAILLPMSQSYYPREAGTSLVWALPRSLATTWGIINLFSLPPGTKMFQFPGFASIIWIDNGLCRWVVPFGGLRINGHLHLPAAFRSLSRPSSPERAKASAMRPFLLSLDSNLNA